MADKVIPRPIYMYDKSKPVYDPIVVWDIHSSTWLFARYDRELDYFKLEGTDYKRVHPSHYFTYQGWFTYGYSFYTTFPLNLALDGGWIDSIAPYDKLVYEPEGL